MKKTIEYRHGKVSYLDNDLYIGRALSLYGEREEKEVEFVCSLVEPDDVVIDVGANIGLLTVPLAQKGAKVYAFEPQPRMFELLKENIEQNELNVAAHQLALGSVFGKAAIPHIDYDKPDNFGGVPLVPGEGVKIATLDSFNLDACKLIKIDVEGMEADVLNGAKETIKRFSPLLYVENDRVEKSPALIALINELGYHLYWHVPYLYNADNFNKVKENIFPNTVTINMLCVPRSQTQIEQTSGLRRIVSIYDRENGRAVLPSHVKPSNGWAGVARFGGIGDNLMAACAVQALKKKGLKVEVITSKDCAWQVFENNPNIDKLSIKSKNEIPALGGVEWQKWFWGRSDEFDVFAHLSHSCEGLLAFFQASTQFHWPAHVRRKLANKNYLEQVLDIAGCDYSFGPLFYASEAEHKKALETKAKVGKRCISLVMSGSRIDKLHPRLPGVVTRLISELDAPVVLLGDEGCYNNAKQIEKFVIDTNGSSRNFHVAISSEKDQAGHRLIDWPVRRTLSFALVSDLVIGPDTGIMWGVAFEKMPKIMLLGHASPENITKHWINTTTLHADTSTVHCWPCHQLHDDPPMPQPGFISFCTPNADNSGAACISSISIETIIQHAKVLWTQAEDQIDERSRPGGLIQIHH